MPEVCTFQNHQPSMCSFVASCSGLQLSCVTHPLMGRKKVLASFYFLRYECITRKHKFPYSTSADFFISQDYLIVSLSRKAFWVMESMRRQVGLDWLLVFSFLFLFFFLGWVDKEEQWFSSVQVCHSVLAGSPSPVIFSAKSPGSDNPSGVNPGLSSSLTLMFDFTQIILFHSVWFLLYKMLLVIIPYFISIRTEM